MSAYCTARITPDELGLDLLNHAVHGSRAVPEIAASHSTTSCQYHNVVKIRRISRMAASDEAKVDLHGLGNSQRLQVSDVLVADQLPHKDAIAPHVSLHASSLMSYHLQALPHTPVMLEPCANGVKTDHVRE